MRALSVATLVLALLTTACAQARQQVDLLAPHVAAGAEPSRAPETSASSSVQSIPVQPASAASTSAPAPALQPSSANTAAAPAQPTAIPATPAPAVSVASAGPRGLLEPMAHEYETWNNCAPVTAEMVLSYYGIQKRQVDIAPVIRPNPKNFSVRLDQIGTYLAQFNLQSRPLIGGTFPLLKTFVSNGIPVVLEDQLSLQDDYGHFRVARGYDDAAGVIILGDSYYGPTNRLSYNLYGELWKRHDYAFMPVYRPEQANLVKAILGADFDPNVNLATATAAARLAVQAQPNDGFAWLNLGQDLYRSGQFDQAISAWDHAKTLSLTPRTLWYTIWPAAAYNHLGQYQQALAVTATPLATDPNNAEALLERGNAERGLGKLVQARADFTAAADVDPSLAPAKQALASLG